MILPGMGVISELVTCSRESAIFGYGFVAFSSMAIAVLGFLVWGHHMFVTGQCVYVGPVFSLLSFLVAVPSAIKVFNWTATMYRGSISYDTPMLYAFGFIGLFTIGGLTGLYLATLAVDVQTHETYFVVAHFHYVMVGGMVMAFLGGLHFWWPKMTGRMYPERWSKFAACDFRRVQSHVLPAIHSGLPGHAPALSCLSTRVPGAQRIVHRGRDSLGVGYIIPVIYLTVVVEIREKAGNNPWGAAGWSGRFSLRPRRTISIRPHRNRRSLQSRTNRRGGTWLRLL